MTTSSEHLVIGVAGTHCSGQDTFGRHLEDTYGFFFRASGDLVRKESMRLTGSIDRPVLQDVAERLRYQNGPGYFIELAIREFMESGKSNAAISGIRTLGELAIIKQRRGVLVFTDAPVEIRYHWALERSRDNEAEIGLDEFLAREKREYYAGDNPADFNRRDIEKVADIRVENTGSLEEFKVVVDGVAASLGIKLVDHGE